jgi:hypothetical protein
MPVPMIKISATYQTEIGDVLVDSKTLGVVVLRGWRLWPDTTKEMVFCWMAFSEMGHPVYQGTWETNLVTVVEDANLFIKCPV